MSNLIPELGTRIQNVGAADVVLSNDNRNYLCRVVYDTVKGEWVIASRLNPKTGRWSPVGGQRRQGMFLFINDWEPPSPGEHKTLVVSSVLKTGKGVFADVE